MGSKGKNVTTGYRYFFGIHMGLSRGPIDELIEIRVGDKVAWKGSQKTSGIINIDAPELFGGDKQEGGIIGPFHLLMGEPTQTAPAGLVTMLKHALPGFRRMVTAYFNGRIATNSPYPKPWKFRERRTTKGWQDDICWYPEKVTITLPGLTPEAGEIKAMNGAHIIYECITNREWGRGLPATSINAASFTACADTLMEEGFGLCLRWNRRDALQSFVQSVLDHIGGVIYSDRETSLLTLKLIRHDYVAENLPIYDTDSGLLQIQEATITSLGPAVNEVRVQYTDILNSGQSRTVQAQNLASLQATKGVFNSLKKDYPGVPTASLALRLAQRDLRANAMSLRRFKLVFDRRAWRIPPAGVLRIRDPIRGIGSIVVRVGRIEDGTLVNGQIIITAVQDVFAFPEFSFIGDEPPQWVPPVTKPELKRHRVFELPYALLNRNLAPADFAYLPDDGGYIGTVVEKPTPLSLNYSFSVKNAPSTPDENPAP